MTEGRLLHVPGLCVYTVPKVASYAIRSAMKRAKTANPNEDIPGFRFMVVRHPLERLVSCWAFFGHNRGMAFEDFWGVCRQNYMQDVHTMPQACFTGGRRMDRRVRLEALNEEWDKIREKFPRLGRIKQRNASEHGPWQAYFTPDIQAEAEEIYAADLALYRSAIG